MSYSYSRKSFYGINNVNSLFLNFKKTTIIPKNLKISSNLLTRLNQTRSYVSYFLNSWIYSTNHKKISINYFWFVLLSGVVGMVLATLIRIELSYPGIGILAGDNSQYLSIASAHGVIMVFFMAMPLLFGFFTNFLLPTQLGVHDVAFPRMNSAAFWFLPASLIVLCQLVCVDRRYQRMNCYNVKELQSLVRKRFFFEILDNNVLNENLNNSFISIRNLNNQTSRNNLNSFYFFNLDNKSNLNSFFSLGYYTDNYLKFFYNSYFLLFSYCWLNFVSLVYIVTNLLKLLIKYLFKFITVVIYEIYDNFLTLSWYNKIYIMPYGQLNYYFDSLADYYGYDNSLGYVLEGYNLESYYEEKFREKFNNRFGEKYMDFIIYILSKVLPELLFNVLKSLNLDVFNFKFNYILGSSINTNNFEFYLKKDNFLKFLQNNLNFAKTNIEDNYSKRFLLFENGDIKFKVKVGNYLPKIPYEQNFDNIFSTFNFKTLTGKKSLWLNSDYINSIVESKINYFNDPKTFLFTNKNYIREEYIESTFDFIFFYIVALSKDIIKFNLQNKWVSDVYFDYSALNIFVNRNKQLFIWNNWKNLKLTREGWRCRLLVSRNQHSLYKKYINESDLIWVVDKNAKDLIPGWAMITPFSARTKYTLIGKVDVGLWVVLFTLFSSIISCSNFLITYRYLSTLNNRKMRDARSFFSEAIIVTCWMTIAANPMLMFGIILLLSDRHWKTSFFDYSGGGDTVLFQHMFWFFGHPEVYIIIIPCFGFVNTILSFYLRKRISARASLMYSMYTIAFLGFFVWGHHMYMVGLSHTTRMLYSTLTVMISVPAATKLMHWFITFINSSLHLELPLIFVLNFIFSFVSGGISGMSVAHTGMDILFHDSFYVIGHFHVMLSGSLMFAGFAGIYFYFPAIFGVRYNRFFAYLHYIYYTVGQLFTVIPMMWLGYNGMPRRVMDYPAVLGGWHSISTSSHILSIAGILCFIFMLFDSLRKKKTYIVRTFGVGRYNTRLNFYLYEVNKHNYWQKKYLFLLKNKVYTNNIYLYNKVNNYELYDNSISYYLIKK